MNFEIIELYKEIELYKNIIINLIKNNKSNYSNIINLKQLEEYINRNKLIDDIIYYILLQKYNDENNIIINANITRLQNTLINYEILLQKNNIPK